MWIARAVITGAIAGFLIAFALPPWGWWPLALVGFALFDHMCDGASRIERFAGGWACGFVWLAMGELWMLDLTPPGYVFVFFVFGAAYGVAAIAAGGDDSRLVRLPAAIVIVEWLRWSWPFGGVPLATVPMTQVDSPLNAVLPLAGALLLTAVTVATGMVLRSVVLRRFDHAAIAAGAVAVAVIAGSIAPTGTSIGTLDVAVVQGGGEQRTRANSCNNQTVFDVHAAATSTIPRPIDLLVWPENVVNPEPDGSSLGACADILTMTEATESVAQIARDTNAVFLPGWFHGDGSGGTVNYSTAVDSSGQQVSRYDKVRLVPFGEFVPLRGFIERFSSEVPNRDVVAGTGPAVLETPIGTFGVNISWEIFFDSRGRAAVRDGGEILINPTNGASYWLTILQSQQIASSRLRAMETGRWVLQAAPTGFSSVIDATGTVLERTGVSEQRVLLATVERREGLTFATRVGAWPMLLLAVGALLVVSLRASQSRARRSPEQPA